MVAKRKKVASPTGRPSKVNPDVDAAMRGKGGKRTSTYTGTGGSAAGSGSKRGLTEAEKMDRGMALSGKKKARKKAVKKRR